MQITVPKHSNGANICKNSTEALTSYFAMLYQII